METVDYCKFSHYYEAVLCSKEFGQELVPRRRRCHATNARNVLGLSEVGKYVALWNKYNNCCSNYFVTKLGLLSWKVKASTCLCSRGSLPRYLGTSENAAIGYRQNGSLRWEQAGSWGWGLGLGAGGRGPCRITLPRPSVFPPAILSTATAFKVRMASPWPPI